MKRALVLMGAMLTLMAGNVRAQVYEMYYQGFESGQSATYSVTTSGSEADSVLVRTGSRSLRLLQNKTADVELVLDTIDFSQNVALRYVALEFDHVCNLPTNGSRGVGEIYVKRAGQSDDSYVQLSGSEYNRDGDTYSDPFTMLLAFNRASYDEWDVAAVDNSSWKHERFDIDNILGGASTTAERKLIIKFKLDRRTVSGDVPADGGWWLDNVRVRASQSKIVSPKLDMVVYPDGELLPSSRGAKVALDAYTSVAEGIDGDSVYVVYRVGSSGVEHRVAMASQGAAQRHDGVAATRFACRIPFYGYDTLMRFYCVVKDATTNANEVTFPKSGGQWVEYRCVRGEAQTNSTIPAALTGTSTSTAFPFPKYIDNRSEWIYDSALMASAGYGPGGITAMRFVLGGAVQAQTRTNLQIRMKNEGTDYTVSGKQNYVSGYMHVVWDSTLSIAAADAGSEVVIRLQDTFFYAGKDVVMQVIYDGTGSADPEAASVQTIATGSNKLSKVRNGKSYSAGVNTYTDEEFLEPSSVERVRPVVVMTAVENQVLVHDMGVAAIVFPNETSPIVSQPAQLQVQLKNYGEDAVQAIRISYAIDGTIPTGYYDWTGNLAGQASATVTIATGVTLAAGYHTIRAWVEDTLTSSGARYRDHEPLNDTAAAEFIVCAGPLRGVKTVGGTGSDYATLHELLFDIGSCGVNDSVIVRLAPGYYEPFVMPAISGISATHYIVFEPANGSVVFYADTTVGNATAIADLTSGGYVRFRNVGFVRRSGALSYMAELGVSSTDCRFEGCWFTDSLSGQSSDMRIAAMVFTGGANNVVVNGCRFVGGGVGVDIQGISASSRATGCSVSKSYFKGQYTDAISVRNATGTKVVGNEMYDVESSASAVVIVYQCNGATEISANKIYTSHGASGLMVSGVEGTSAQHALVANNMIVCADDGAATTAQTPLNVLQGAWLDVVYNAVKHNAATRSNLPAVVFGGIQTTNSRLMNNIIACYDGVNFALSLQTSTPSSNQLGNNVYYSAGSTLNRVGAVSYSSLDAWQSAVTLDGNSLSLDPVFLNTELVDLRTYNRFIKGKGTPISGVASDMFGTARSSSSPCPGAFEYASLQYDFEVDALVSPVADTCQMPATVALTVRLRNNGIRSYAIGTGDTLWISCQMNGGEVRKVAVGHSVPSEDTITVSTGLTYQLPANGIYDSVYVVKVWVAYAGDPNQTNDTSLFTVVSRYHQEAADDLAMTIPYASQATVVPSSGVAQWSVYANGSAPKKRSQLFWYRSMSDVVPFYQGDTLQTDVLRQDTHYYFKQRRLLPVVRLTQVQIKGTGAVGLTSPMPSWMGSSTLLAVQLTNVGDDTAYLAGDTLKMVSDVAAINNQYIRFGDVRIAPGKAMVVQFAAGTSTNASKTVYTGLNMSQSPTASTKFGLIYKHESEVEDAVAINSIESNARWTTMAVPSYVWSGSGVNVSPSTTGGIVRQAFNGMASDWRMATTAQPMMIDTIAEGWLMYVDNGCPTEFATATVNMATHPAVDISLQAGNLASGCNLGNEEVSVIVHNYGQQAATGVQLHYTAGGPVVSETMSGSVASGADVTFTFTQRLNMAVAQDSLFRVVIWATKLSADSEQSNDTTVVQSLARYTPSAPVLASTMSVPYGTSATVSPTPLPRATMIWYDSLDNPIDTANNYVSAPLYETTLLGVSYLMADSSGGQIGSAATRTTATAYPSPYQPYNAMAKQQYIYSASELRTLGIEAGNITAVAFHLDSILGSVQSLTFSKYYISMGLTDDTLFSSMTAWKATQVVYNRSSFSVSRSDIGQWVSHKLDTPFVWDGMSNLVVQVVHENTSAVTTGVQTTYSSKSNSCLTYGSNSSLSPSALDYTGSGRMSGNRPNIHIEQVLYSCQSPKVYTTITLSGQPNVDARITWPDGYDTVTYTSCSNIALNVKLQNLGLQAFNSVNLHYTIDGTTVGSTTINSVLARGNATTVQLFSRPLKPGRHYVVAWVALSGDEETSNDTIVLPLTVKFCAGSYTIAQTASADYRSFGEAVDSLVQVGIAGSVVFNVAQGTYTEQVSLGAIGGTSQAQTVTFRGASVSSTTLKAATSQSINYVLNIDGASNVVWEGMTITSRPQSGNFGNVLVIQNASHITLQNNMVKVSGNIDNDNASCIVLQGNVDGLTLQGNTLDSGYYSLREKGTAYNYTNITIQGNTFTNFRYGAVALQGATNVSIAANSMLSGHTTINRGLVGIGLTQVDGTLSISKNTIYLADDMNGGKQGINLNKVKCTASSSGTVVNNMISACGTGATALSNPGGIVATDCEYLNIIYNSILTRTGSSTISRGMLLTQSATDTSHHLTVMNNVIVNRSSYAYYVSPSTVVAASDYNNYVSPTGLPIAYWNADQYTLTNLQSANGRDGSSMAEEVYFVNDTNLHLSMTNLSGKAQYNPDVIDDIDGNARPQLPPPTIGAHEVSLTAHDMALVRVISPVMPVSIARPINIESDSILVKALFYNNGSSTESNAYWYAYVEGYGAATRSANRSLGTMLPTQSKTDSVWLYSPLGVVDSQSVKIVLVAPTDDDASNNTASAPFYIAPAFNLGAVSIATSKTGCDMQQTQVLLTLSNDGAKDIPTGFTIEVGYSAQAYYPTYDASNPSAYRQAVSTMPGSIRENITLTNPFQRGTSQTFTFSAPANFYPTDTAINLKIMLRGWCNLTYDLVPTNDSVWSDVINSYYSPRPAVGHDTTLAYATWGEVTASQPDYRPIQWYRDTTASPFYNMSNYFSSCRWSNTPIFTHDSTYYLRSVSDLGCLSAFTEVHVHVAAQQTNDVGVATVLAPMGRRVYTENDTVRVRITNYGTQSQRSFPVTYEVRGGNNQAPFQVVTETCEVSIAPNQSYDFKFDSLISFTDPLEGKNYYLRVWTDLANDATRRNDTIRWTNSLRPAATNNTTVDYPFVTLPETNYGIRANIPNDASVDVVRVSFNEIDFEMPPLGRSFTNMAGFTSPEYPVLRLPRGSQDTLTIAIQNPADPEATPNGMVAAYIDFDRSGTFLDAGEEVLPATRVNSREPIKVGITIPQSAANGHMRLRVVASNEGKAPIPTLASSDGHIVDFLIFIDPEPAFTDLALTQVASPYSSLLRTDSNLAVAFRMSNKGTSTINNATFHYSYYFRDLDSTYNGTFDWSGTLSTGRSTLVKLPPVLIPCGTADFKVWHSTPSDANTSNDTLAHEYHRPYVVTLVYNDNFNGEDLWYAPTGRTKYTRNQWQRGITTKPTFSSAHSYPNAWATNLTTDITVGTWGNMSYLYSPIINISQIRADSVAFYLCRMFDTISVSYLRLEYLDYTGTWRNMRDEADSTWYTNEQRTAFDNVGQNAHLNSSGKATYQRFAFSTSSTGIGDEFNEMLQLRFVYVAAQGSNENSTCGSGCAIDDFLVTRARRPIDVGAFKVTYPTAPRVGDIVYPQVAVKNYGLDTVYTFQMGYTTYENYIPTITTVQCAIPPDSVDTFAFPNPIVITSDFPDTFAITAFTALVEDIYVENDTVRTKFRLSPLDHDISVVEFVSPRPTVIGGDSVAVTLRIRNFGIDSISRATLSFIFNTNTRCDEEVDFTQLIGRPLATFEYFNYTFSTKVRVPMGMMNFVGIAKCDANDYLGNDTIRLRVSGISSVTDVAASSLIIDSSSFNSMRVQLVIDNRGARGANNFEVGFWYDNDTSTIHRETFHRDTPIPALTSYTHAFNIELPTRQIPYSQVVGFVHIDNDHDPSNDTTYSRSTQYVDLEVLSVLVEENANPDCRVFLRLRNIGNLAVENRIVPLRAVVNGVELANNTTRSFAPGDIVNVEFPTTIPKNDLRRYSGSGWLQSFPMDNNSSNNQTSVVRVVNYMEGIPLVDAGLFTLGQNYPNPAAQSTTIPFSLPSDAEVHFFVMDALGKRVVSQHFFAPAGENSLQLDLRPLASGVYYYGLEVDGERRMLKLIHR
ncbi:MAG: T9SS type A sorting domain-containing protein [Bacteroidales bacterium]|nr:T9SS type A sorting domain-containing protein [Bacteroidales bacterium]